VRAKSPYLAPQDDDSLGLSLSVLPRRSREKCRLVLDAIDKAAHPLLLGRNLLDKTM
jgi:hypothetical protein